MTTDSYTLELFGQISAVPRGSQQEEKIRQWLIDWAAGQGLAYRTDAAGNLAIYVPAGRDYEDRSPIILQSHMDMVCQKNPDSTHDFTHDPIELVQDGDWLRANGTTLGADNGIGMALSLAMAAEPARPALELLFTVAEEIGVIGAGQLDVSLITGKTLINLDSEEEGAFTIGCAGGAATDITVPLVWEKPAPTCTAFDLKIGGLLGGHSGEDIQLPRANAIKLVARVLNFLQRALPVHLTDFKGGTARNAIPREAQAGFVCPTAEAARCRVLFEQIAQSIQEEYGPVETGMWLALEEQAALPERVAGLAGSRRALNMVTALPNGVSAFSAEIPGFVETSNNIGVIEMKEQGLEVVSNARSSVLSRLEEITQRTEALAALADAEVDPGSVFHPWQPDLASPLLERCKRVYTAVFSQQPAIRLTHGGLECGLISQLCGGLDTLSLGATIEQLHSPGEQLYVPSVERLRVFLAALLASF
jgi:dipeptidase D